MSYVRRRAALGNPVAVGMQVYSAIKTGATVWNSLFGKNGQDAQRQARVDVFSQGGKQGSVWACRVLLGGITNTASHESPMYVKAANALAGTPAMNEAERLGAYWDSTDDAASSKMCAKINAELQGLGASAVTSPGAGVHMLPAMTTTADFNWTPYLIGGGVLAALAFSGALGGRRRRR